MFAVDISPTLVPFSEASGGSRVPTESISARVPTALLGAVRDAMRLKGHGTLSEAVIAGLLLYVHEAASDDSAIEELKASQQRLRHVVSL